MKMQKKVLAMDFGASGGRAMIGSFDGERIGIQEVHRFSNDPVILNGTMYWDVLRLLHETKQSLIKTKKYGRIESIAVDTWGVDFGLLDKNGDLMGNPVHYRDKRTNGMLEKGFEKIDKEEFYHITGNQFMEINTAFQLLSLKENHPDMLNRTKNMLLMPDLLHYFLGGEIKAEISIASTTQLFDARHKTWADTVIGRLGLPREIFPEVVPSGTLIGCLSNCICQELMMEPVKMIAVAGHDTQSALVAAPAIEKDFIFLSCGTWSLFGTELDVPIINEKSLKRNITNEYGYENKISFLKNIIGLWLVQESRRQWLREGKEFSFGEMEKMAEEAEPFRSFVDPDDPVFVSSGDIPKRIREYCLKTKQPVPETEGEIVRCINESLAIKYRLALEEMKECTGKEYEVIYMLGGGTRSSLLCKMTAGACNCRVSVGTTEATVTGNVAVQLIASGDIKDIREARAVIRNSQKAHYYEPEQKAEWEQALERFIEITG